MLKKSLLSGIVAIVLLAVPALAPPPGPGPTPPPHPGQQLAAEIVPVKMVIDKTVTLDVEGGEILLSNLYHTDDWVGQTTVNITHNFPVIVKAQIMPWGVVIGSSYWCAIGDFHGPAPMSHMNDGQDMRLFPYPAPAPVGETFFLGARVNNVDIGWITSDPAPQQVATILLTVYDNL